VLAMVFLLLNVVGNWVVVPDAGTPAATSPPVGGGEIPAGLGDRPDETEAPSPLADEPEDVPPPVEPEEDSGPPQDTEAESAPEAD